MDRGGNAKQTRLPFPVASSPTPVKGWPMAKPPATRKIPHVRSEFYRNVVVDNAISTFIDQGSSARLRLTLTRLDVITQWDNVEDIAGVGFIIVPGDIGETQQRVIEFTADMSPDQALIVVNVILETLSKIPDDKKEQYRIPKNIAQIPPPPSKGAP